MISVTILSKNSAQYLEEVLESLRAFPEVVVLDSGSEDDTLRIANAFPNVQVFEEPFRGFGEMHNRAAELASYPWILSIDSDEVPSTELINEVVGMDLSIDTVYSIPRRNLFNGKFIRYGGWHPDRCLRLYNRESTRWTDAKVHESVMTDGMRVEELQGWLTHYSYNDLSHFLAKMQAYSDLFAQQRQGKVGSGPCKAALHGVWTFIKTYLLKRGILDGYEGFVIAVYNAQTAFWKYLKLYEANQDCERYQNPGS